MPELKIAFLGDVVGALGRRAVAHSWPKLREAGHQILIVNGENSKNGSGLSPDNFRELKRSGAHAVTLGDHWGKDRAIFPTLEDVHEPIARPANLAAAAPGKRITRVPTDHLGGTWPPIYVMTVLGRVYMPLPSDNPFAAVDRELGLLAKGEDKNALVIVEIHGEVTSEKQAMAWHCLERHTGAKAANQPAVVAVVGSHTHVQTADARVLDHTLAAMTDLGMCGPHRSVIGRDIQATLRAMVDQSPMALDVASDDNRATGASIRIDIEGRRAIGIEGIQIVVPE